MSSHYEIAAFYRFIPVEDVASLKATLEREAAALGVEGVIIVAPEGINGTVAAPVIERYLEVLRRETGLRPDRVRLTVSEQTPFRRMSVRSKEELVASGRRDALDGSPRGTYVDPEAWDELILRDDVTLIDCRNSYEIELGSFQGARDPGTDTFRSFADFADELDPEDHPRVAMFCTGGIRCEKATAYMLQRGFEEVYHLRGGILGYLEERGPDSSTWRGECFVFDRRVSVDRELAPGTHTLCWGCRMPLTETDLQSPLYEEGVSCPRCHDQFSAEERAAKRERHRQFCRERTG